ncbi:MAG: hypothetical protein J7M34_00335 [Anaerolineae bacterium]|nr:hypothetical protein [Anaerolineae bacterium]
MSRWFYIISGATLIIIPVVALTAPQGLLRELLLMAVAEGILHTHSLTDVPHYAFAGGVVIELIGMCIGVWLLGRAILYRSSE